MKKHLLLLFNVAVCWLWPAGLLGQTYDFASAGLSDTVWPGLIRTVNATDAVTVYHKPDGSQYLALINTSGVVKTVKIDSTYRVRDMRVAGSEVYMCGFCPTGGFLAHFPLSGFVSVSPQITYVTIDPGHSDRLERMAAFKVGGMEKVVAVGQHEYDTTLVSGLGDTTHAIYGHSIVVEADFQQGVFQTLRMKADTGHTERFCDVMATRNYVAVVGGWNDEYLSIHRCDKADVLGTFDSYSYYHVGPSEGLSPYLGCAMRGDTIAVSSMASSDPQLQTFETRLRVFDLAAMTMTQAQKTDLVEKSAPGEMVYMPEHLTLLMTHEYNDPSGTQMQNIYWLPYASAPYQARSLTEPLPGAGFGGLDRLSRDYYVTLGNGCWVMKYLPSDQIPNSCYDIRKWYVDLIPPVEKEERGQQYREISSHHTFDDGRPIIRNPMTMNCSLSNP